MERRFSNGIEIDRRTLDKREARVDEGSSLECEIRSLGDDAASSGDEACKGDSTKSDGLSALSRMRGNGLDIGARSLRRLERDETDELEDRGPNNEKRR